MNRGDIAEIWKLVRIWNFFCRSLESVENGRALVGVTAEFQALAIRRDVSYLVRGSVSAVPSDLLAEVGAIDQVESLGGSAKDDAVDVKSPFVKCKLLSLDKSFWW